MPKKHKPSPEDVAQFEEAMKGTKRLIIKKIRLSPSQPKKRIYPPREEFDSFHLDEASDLPAVTGDEFLSFRHPSISDKILRKLRKGQYNVEAVLDMHGMSVEDARMTVDKFITESLRNGIRVILIIHGKGTHSREPILKNKLNQWLRQIDMVLAFCSATASHGSRGAVYVLLKDMTSKED